MRAFLLVLLVTGIASRYDPGVFDMVAANRGLTQWEGGHVAVLDCDLVGSTVYICDEEKKCWWAQVTDCAGIADGGYDWMVRNNIAGELDYHYGKDRVGSIISIYTKEYVYDYGGRRREGRDRYIYE